MADPRAAAEATIVGSMSVPSSTGGAPLTFLTVALGPELPFARVLAHSVRAHHPDARIVVVAADGAAPEGLPKHAVALGFADLGLPAPVPQAAVLLPERTTFAALISALERELSAEGTVVVLGPDSVVLSPLEQLLAGDEPLVVSGRAAPDPPHDGLHPDADDLKMLPSIEPGVLVVRGEATRDVLRGWRDRIALAEWDAIPRSGMEGLPGPLAEAVPFASTIGRASTVLGWWNIWSVTLGGDGQAPTADGEPIEVLRLPGFDIALPTRLHPGQNRVRVSSDPVLRGLLDDVTARLRAAGAQATRPDPLRLPDGRPVPPVMTVLMGEAIVAGVLPGPPRADAEWERFHAFLNEPAQHSRDRGMTRYLDALWHARDDLRTVYPEVPGEDVDGYLGWAWVHGRDLVPDALLPPRPAHIPAEVRQQGGAVAVDRTHFDPLWGVNVAGYFSAELGLGEAARLLIAGLDAVRVPALPIQGASIPPCRQGAEFTFATPDEAPYPLNILCLNGDAIPAFAEEAGPAFFEGRHTIALWWWEVGDLPAAWHDAFRWVDEVWVATEHIRDLIAPNCPVPVTKITLPVGAPPVSSVTRADIGYPEDAFVFLYVYDYHSTEARKNPTGLIKAFKAAFPPGSGAHLVLKCINADRMFAHHDRVLLEAADHPDISFIDRYLSVGEKNALMALADCYVSPHRSEGFGLTPAEAMLLGKPVIATGYGGVLEFLTSENAYLVDYELRRVGEHAEPYPADAEWADPDLGQLARLMRHVFEHPDEAAERGRHGAVEVREGHTPAAAGQSMEPLLQARYQDLIAQGARSLRVTRATPLPPAAPEAELRSVLRGASERGGFVGRAKWLRQRLGRPITARRDVVAKQLLDRIGELDARVLELTGELERHRLAAHAQVLAQFRRSGLELRALQQTSEAQAEANHRGRLKLDEHARLLERHLPEGGTLRERYPVARRPFTPAYAARHDAFLLDMLGNDALLDRFRRLAPLPAGYGVGLDERVVEFPWLLSRAWGARVLDAGSVLNHPHVLDAFLPRIGKLTITTLVTERETFQERGVRYFSADLRDLPVDDGAYDLVVCGSTLEHVGMDNSRYGAAGASAPDPLADQRAALHELVRVTAPGGRVLLTVPYGRREDHGWLLQFDALSLSQVLDGLPAEVDYYGYRASGWQRSSPVALRGAGYRDAHVDASPAPDAAAAARGVACVTITKPTSA